jgi:hypothetical protein
MANIKLKKVTELHTWDAKELRKLRMTIRNRISSLELTDKPKKLAEDHPLFDLEIGQCRQLLEKVISAEKK